MITNWNQAPRASVCSVVNDDGAVLLDLDRGLLFSLNPIAAVIWQQLSEHRSVEEISRYLVERCGAPLDRVEADVAAFIRELSQQRLVAATPEPSVESTGRGGAPAF